MTLEPGTGTAGSLAAERGDPLAIYEETQLFGWWAYATLAFTLATTVFAVYMVVQDDPAALPYGNPALLATAALHLAIMALLVLKTRIDGAQIRVRLGLLPLFRTSISLADIQDARVVTYRPIRDAGGWGLRFGRIDGEPCTFWNARGNQGVYIVTEKKRYLIGSQRPDDLLAAITQGRPDRIR